MKNSPCDDYLWHIYNRKSDGPMTKTAEEARSILDGLLFKQDDQGVTMRPGFDGWESVFAKATTDIRAAFTAKWPGNAPILLVKKNTKEVRITHRGNDVGEILCVALAAACGIDPSELDTADLRQRVKNQPLTSAQTQGNAKPAQAAPAAPTQAAPAAPTQAAPAAPTQAAPAAPAQAAPAAPAQDAPQAQSSPATYANPPNLDGFSFAVDDKGVEFKMSETLDLNLAAGRKALNEKWSSSTPLVQKKLSSYRITLFGRDRAQAFCVFIAAACGCNPDAFDEADIKNRMEKQKLDKPRPKPSPISSSSVRQASKYSAWSKVTGWKPDKEFLAFLRTVKFYDEQPSGSTARQVTVRFSDQPKFNMDVLKKKILEKRLGNVMKVYQEGFTLRLTDTNKWADGVRYALAFVFNGHEEAVTFRELRIMIREQRCNPQEMHPVNETRNPDGPSKPKDYEVHEKDPDLPDVEVSKDVANKIRKLLGLPPSDEGFTLRFR